MALDGPPHPDPLSPAAGRQPRRVAFATCTQVPDLADDDALTREPLAALGVQLVAAAWDDPAVDWAGFDLTVVRSTWDYAGRRDEFVAWAATVPRLANPAGVIAWNTDKRYLRELAAAGTPVVPTDWVGPGDRWAVPSGGDWVVKPAVSAGGRDSGRYDTADPGQRELAAAHVARLQAAGRTVMVQPYLGAIDTAGETSLLFLGGRYSHAIRKAALLHGPDSGVDGLFRAEEIVARTPSPAEHAVAAAVLRRLPVWPLLYARVDLIPGPAGGPLVVEVELTEPSLFLDLDPGAPHRLAEAIVEWHIS